MTTSKKKSSVSKQCLWCLKNEPEVTFNKKAHTIPKALGGQNYNNNVCDNCNEYFGNRNMHNNKYSIEEALKETFNITRKRLLGNGNTRRKVGRFKSKFFEVKERNGKYRLIIKDSFRFTPSFQQELSRAFRRGLLKMYFEELNRQNKVGYEEKYDVIRKFARYDDGDIPMFYFNRLYGIIMTFEREAETPILFFDRMKDLYSNEKFTEIEFLGHTFGFPITEYSVEDFDNYINTSLKLKKGFYKNAIRIEKLIDIDLALNILNDNKK